MSVYLLAFTKKWAFAANSIVELNFKQYAFHTTFLCATQEHNADDLDYLRKCSYCIRAFVSIILKQNVYLFIESSFFPH